MASAAWPTWDMSPSGQGLCIFIPALLHSLKTGSRPWGTCQALDAGATSLSRTGKAPGSFMELTSTRQNSRVLKRVTIPVFCLSPS